MFGFGEIDVNVQGFLELRGPRSILDRGVGMACGRMEKGGYVSLPPSPLAVSRLTTWRVRPTQRLTDWLEAQARMRERLQEAEEDAPTEDGLYPHQTRFQARVRILGHQYAADATGTGKTVSALAAVRGAERVLVVCPSIVRWQWEEHVSQWTDLEAQVFPSGSRAERLSFLSRLPERFALIFPWDSLSRYHEVLRDIDWDAIIADEAHYAKNRKALRTQALTGCHGEWGRSRFQALRAPVQIALSGTPIERSAADLWPILYWFYPRTFQSYWRTAEWFSDVRPSRWADTFEVSGVRDPEILADTLRPFFRRVELEELTEVPEIVWRPLPVELDPEHMEAYRQTVRETKLDNPLAAIVRLRQMAIGGPNSAKMEAARLCLQEARTVVLFSSFRRPLFHLGDEDEILIGDTPLAERRRILERFRSQGGRLLMTTALGGVGLDFPHCSYAVFLDLPWSYTQFTQALGRIRRLESGAPVVVTLLIARGTIDERIHRVLARKQEVSLEFLRKLLEAHVEEVG